MTKRLCSRQMLVWIAALFLGFVIGQLNVQWMDDLTNFVATIFTRLFQLLAVPTIALAVTTTLASLGNKSGTGRIFRRTLIYTLLTTIAAALVALALYNFLQPSSLPSLLVSKGNHSLPDNLDNISYYDHILNVIPNNVVAPFLEGNVLSILILSAATGLALAKLPSSNQKTAILNVLLGFQDVLFLLIRALIWILPIGIVAYAAQLSAQLSVDTVANSLGLYMTVVVLGNVIQFVVVLPLFLLARGVNPLKTLRDQLPAVLMAFFTKSSAATLPVTIQCAEERTGVRSQIARFVLPICTTINMNGCAAFILVTSLFVMQNAGVSLSLGTMFVWLLVAVVSAIGNAGVPMGCYFLTLSLMTGIGMPVGIMGVILPIYTVIDMVETAENVWSDSCVCTLVSHDVKCEILSDEAA